VLAKLAGVQSLLGASDWIEDQQERLHAHLHLSWKRMPCTNTHKDALARLDSQQVNAQLVAWLVRNEAQSRCGEEPSRLAEQASQRSVHLAIDGKALQAIEIISLQPKGVASPVPPRCLQQESHHAVMKRVVAWHTAYSSASSAPRGNPR
jgi:hypothetical protein